MDLERLFYPRSVAVIGASPNMATGRAPYYQMLKMAGYKGRLYAVNPRHKEIDGQPVYPALDAVPGPVDLAIAVVPARFALETVEAAVRKGVPFLHFFTSGFSEVGDRALEEALLETARRGVTRIVGPNCLGVHCTDAGVTFDPTLRQEGPGEVAFLGQSGGVTIDFMRLARAHLVAVNKAVSYGNQIDLAVEDYLEYLAEDERVRVVAAYIEDVKDGRAFLRALERTTAKKPVIVLKGGITGEGARAAASHTGAMAGRYPVWRAVMRRHRCAEVETEKEMIEAVMLATAEKVPRGPRIAFLGGGGGTSVLFTDLAARSGLTLPALCEEAQQTIGEMIPDVNTSTRNPVDLGAFGFDPKIMIGAMGAADRDEGIDASVIYISLDFMNLFNRKRVAEGFRAIASAARELTKPVIPVLSRLSEDQPELEEIRREALAIFREAGMSMYGEPRAAVRAIRAILPWSMGAGGKRGGDGP